MSKTKGVCLKKEPILSAEHSLQVTTLIDGTTYADIAQENHVGIFNALHHLFPSRKIQAGLDLCGICGETKRGDCGFEFDVLQRTGFCSSADDMRRRLNSLKRSGRSQYYLCNGLFAAAYLSESSSATSSYHFLITCASSTSEGGPREALLPTVSDYLAEEHQEPVSLTQILEKLRQKSHTFLLLVDSQREFWREYYDREQIILVDQPYWISLIEAAVIGIVEGRLDREGVKSFLSNHTGDEMTANMITGRLLRNVLHRLEVDS